VQLKYGLLPFSKMGADDLIAHCISLVKRVNVITGWTIPELQEDRMLLYKELSQHLIESWGMYNPDEIAYSVRFYGAQIESWGKNINLKLLDSCISLYAAKRKELSQMEEQKAEIKEIKALPMSDEDFINDRFVDWFSMKNKKYSFIDVTLFEKLRKKGFLKLSQEEKTKIKKDVMIDMALLEESKEFKDLQTKLEILRSDQSKEDYIQELCKKYAVAQFFNELIKQEKLKVL
jgi:hypothetical protein